MADPRARDTVRLKVVRGLKGSLAAGHEFGVYYHLLWADPRKMVNEAPKFEKGKTYIVFLTSSVEDVDGKRRMVRSLADQWFAVFPENEALEKELTRLLPKPTSGDH